MVLECCLSVMDDENALELAIFPWLDDEPCEIDPMDMPFVSDDEEDGFWDDDNYLF